jgi:hypothetical protein
MAYVAIVHVLPALSDTRRTHTVCVTLSLSIKNQKLAFLFKVILFPGHALHARLPVPQPLQTLELLHVLLAACGTYTSRQRGT